MGKHEDMKTLASIPISTLEIAHASRLYSGKVQAGFNFDCTPQDFTCIGAIVKRAQEIGAQCIPPVQFDTLIAACDVAAVHCNGTPLHLYRFLMSDNADFMRDFGGIGLHVDRATGKLRDDWRPLFAVENPAKVGL
jgi:hypothetical protein